MRTLFATLALCASLAIASAQTYTTNAPTARAVTLGTASNPNAVGVATWPGPTNVLTFSLGTHHQYATVSGVYINGFAGTTTGRKNAAVLEIWNFSGSNITATLPASVRTSDGTRSTVVTNDCGVCFLFELGSRTNCVIEKLW